MTARLRYYFQKAFISPLFMGILMSIFFTALVFINYSNNIKTNPILKPIFRELEEKTNKPYIETTYALIFKKFQPVINNLILFKKFYQSMNLNNFSSNQTKRDKFTDKYSINGFLAYTNYSTVIDQIVQNENDLLDHGLWLRDRVIKNISEMKDAEFTGNTVNTVCKNQLFFATNMIPIFRSVIENKGVKPDNSIKQIYMAFENTELFYLYPLKYNKTETNKYQFFNTSSYITYCHQADGDTVDYYFFKCQPWWKEILTFKAINNLDISITMPYNYEDNTKEVSICLRFDDHFTVKDQGKIKQSNSVAICIDTYIDKITFTLDYFSKNLNGYFFIMRLNSDVPIYYPLTSYKKGHTAISKFEFDFNVTYYLNELENFKRVQNDFNRFIRYTNKTTEAALKKQIIKGNYTKNNLLHNYNVIPVALFLDEEDPTNKTHFFSIVLVMNGNSGNDVGLSPFDSYSRIGTLIIVLAFFGLILLLIGKYLINALADNIVRPLRSLKYIIQGMNNKQILEDKEYTKQEEEIDSKVAREDADISFERTLEIEIFGEMIIKLQNVLKFTTNNKNSNDQFALMKYIYSKYSFQEVFNIKGKNLCDSNVGNLALKCAKYDKAIFHINLALQRELLIVEQLEKNKSKARSNKLKSMSLETQGLISKNARLSNIEIKRNKLLGNNALLIKFRK